MAATVPNSRSWTWVLCFTVGSLERRVILGPSEADLLPRSDAFLLFWPSVRPWREGAMHLAGEARRTGSYSRRMPELETKRQANSCDGAIAAKETVDFLVPSRSKRKAP